MQVSAVNGQGIIGSQVYILIRMHSSCEGHIRPRQDLQVIIIEYGMLEGIDYPTFNNLV